MADIHYTIQFFSYWHCGSGLAAGADIDALVVKDKNGLPYVPGKTMKGLVREAVMTLSAFKKEDKQDLLKESFGYFDDAEKAGKGCMFFTNAELGADEQKAIVDHHYQHHLYDSVASTAIMSNGIAKDHSLRKVEVVVPCTLEGKIKDVPAGLVDALLDALKFVKRLGVNRNRGLGRCSIAGKEVRR